MKDCEDSSLVRFLAGLRRRSGPVSGFYFVIANFWSHLFQGNPSFSLMDKTKRTLLCYARFGGEMAAESRIFFSKIACREIIREDNHSVFSRQWFNIPHNDKTLLTPAFLVESYMAFMRKCTLSIVQPVQSGGKTAFTLFGSSFPLLIFSGPEFSGNDRTQTAALRIEGGLLVQRNECGKGMFSFIIEVVEEGVQVAVQVNDYCPLILGGHKPSIIRKWLYRSTQALIHKIIISRFLCHLCHQLETGKSV